MTLNIRLLHPEATLPQRAHHDDAGLDICAVDSLTLAPGERALVKTGIAIELPPDHLAWVVPRSGLALKHGITIVNAPGLIDPGYRGEIGVILANTDHRTPFRVEVGMRIAQLVIAAVVAPAVHEVGELSVSARGSGGFGSTG